MLKIDIKGPPPRTAVISALGANPTGFVFSWGGPGNPRRRESLPRPHTGPQAQPAGMETAPGFLPGGIISYRGGSNSAHHRYASMNLFGCRSPAEAGDGLDGRLRFERPALAPFARWGSKSRSPSRRTAGLSPERRLLCARANRECATKRAARTAAIEPAGVLAVSSDAKALRCCVLKQKPVVVTTM